MSYFTRSEVMVNGGIIGWGGGGDEMGGVLVVEDRVSYSAGNRVVGV